MRAYPVFMVQKASNRLSAFLVCVCVLAGRGGGVWDGWGGDDVCVPYSFRH